MVGLHLRLRKRLRPTSRLVAALCALAFGAQAAGAARLATPARACCCAVHEEHCPCRSCAHARADAAGQSLFDDCGETQEAVPTAAQLAPALPVAPAVAAPPPRALPLVAAPPASFEEPAAEVPTPPPLARI